MLSSIDRSKLFEAIQRKFPLAKNWRELREKHKNLISAHALSVVGALSLPLPPLAWWLGSLGLGTTLSIGTGFFALVGGFVCTILFVMGVGFIGIGVLGNWSVSKEFKQSQTKQSAREYIQQKKTVQYVKQMIPRLSDEELDLLIQYPHILVFYRNLIKEEQEKRKHIRTAEQIKQTFTVSVDESLPEVEEDIVAVQTPRSLNL